jgi:hypothetical protein
VFIVVVVVVVVVYFVIHSVRKLLDTPSYFVNKAGLIPKYHAISYTEDAEVKPQTLQTFALGGNDWLVSYSDHFNPKTLCKG